MLFFCKKWCLRRVERGLDHSAVFLLRFIELFGCLAFAISVPLNSVQTGSIKSVPELERAMYVPVDGTPCVRLLNVSGEIGCANPGRVKVTAPIRRFETASESLGQSTAILLAFNETEAFFQRVLDEPIFAKEIAGLFIEYESDISLHLSGFSFDRMFPQAEFAPYKEKDYVWNPPGTGLLQHSYNFPVLLLSEESTMTLREVAKLNHEQNFKCPLNVAEFDLVMQTTKSETRNSVSCLKEGTCLPLGGYSVWSSLPPINVSVSTPSKPIVLALASMDSASFFRDRTLGADSPLSGMIAMLAAVDALSHVSLNAAKKQLVFLIVTGEAWGYLGSRQFLAELRSGSDSVKGLNMSLIDQIVEVGSVGKMQLKERSNFFIHAQQKNYGAEYIIEAFQKAAQSFKASSLKVERASASNPGIPPSSLMTFFNQGLSIPGIVLEEFNTAFRNTFYNSVLDDYSNVNSSSITAAASLVARTLYLLALNGSGDDSVLQSIKADELLVQQLLECLIACDPGLSCSLVKDLMTPIESCANHYVGVLQGPPSSSPYSEFIISDTSRFVWNFLANRTSIPRKEFSQCSKDCNSSDELCVGLREGQKGTCLISTTRYVPAYSTRLAYESDAWKVIPAQEDDEMGKFDPVWTESFWRTLGVRVYKQQSSFSDNLILLSGVLLTLCSFIATISTRSFFSKALKND